MAKRTKEVIEVEEGAIEDPAIMRLQDIVDQFPDADLTFLVYRFNDRGKQLFVTELNPDNFTVNHIKENYGGGKFRFYARVAGKTVKTGIFDIEGRAIVIDIIPPGRGNSQPLPGLQPALQPGGQASGVENQILILLERVTSRMDKLEENMKDGAKDKILETLLANMSNNSSGVEDRLLERLSTFKSLFSDNKSGPGSDIGQVFTAVKQVMEIANTAEGGNPWMSIIEKVIPTLQQAVTAYGAQAGRVQRQPGPSKVIPEGAPVDGQPAQPTPPLTGFQAIKSIIEPHIPSLITFAAAGHDTESVGNLILPYLPEQNKADIIAWFGSATWLNDLASIDQRIPAQGAWWNELKDTLLEFLTTEETTGEPEGEEISH